VLLAVDEIEAVRGAEGLPSGLIIGGISVERFILEVLRNYTLRSIAFNLGGREVY
jgi:hypothetical protein